MDKAFVPDDAALKKALGKTFTMWKDIEEYTLSSKPGSSGSWNISGAKYGWNYRVTDKKRVLVYLLPRDGFFKAAFVFGGKAYDEVMAGRVSDNIKSGLKEAKPYAEGRGIRIVVDSNKIVRDIKKLIDIKIRN